MNAIINTLNFPVRPDLKASTNTNQTSLKELPFTDEVSLIASFIAWTHRMTNEDIIALDIHIKGKFYPIEVAFAKETTGQEVVIHVQNALAQVGFMTGKNHIVYTDELLEFNDNIVFQMVVYDNHFYLAGAEQIINTANEQRYLSSLIILANDLQSNGSKAVLDLDILTPEEVSLWKSINDNKKDFPKGETLHQIFTKTASKYPNKIAISNSDKSITFQALEEKSNQLAHCLVSNGVKVGDYIAVYVERSIEAIIGMLGVMKAGGVYVPLAPDNPKERNSYIMHDANIKVVVTTRDCVAQLNGVAPANAQIISIESIDGEKTPVGVKVTADDIAYIIYTSGSTGKPKGVKIQHKAIVTFGYSILEIFPLTSNDTLTQFFTLTFDASFLEVCPMYFTGARMYMLTKAERVDVNLFCKALIREKVTYATAFPISALKQFSLYASDEDVKALHNLKRFGVGGEALTGETVRLYQNKFGDVPLINIYGPTECSVVASTYLIEGKVPEYVMSVPIGKPLNNYSYYVVNENDHLNPIEVPGELLIETEGISQGYLNLPEKTAKVFVMTPLTDHLVYRTGDIVKLLEDGNIEFVGRKDSQVKIRGYRVETGEIEDKLLQIDFVEDGAVVAKDLNGDKTLVAYYKQKDDMQGTQKDLLTILATKVPKYMIPTYFVKVDEFPHLSNGKINRKKLAEMPLELNTGNVEDKKAPSNEVEAKFAESWKEVLGLPAVGVDENFFEIGGHSLKVLATLSKLKREFPTLKINDFFEHPTIEQLAKKVRTDLAETTRQEFTTISKQINLVEHPRRLSSTHIYQPVNQTGILLTGATGFLGCHILIDLVRDTETTIYVLVRAKSKEAGLERIKNTLAFYAPKDFYINFNVKDRIVIIPGDFTMEALGVSKLDEVLIRNNVNSIIHCGADVRHFGDKEEFTKTNVNSTRNLLELATQLPKVRFHYISTLGVPEDLAAEGHWDEFLQMTNMAEAPELTNLYSNSKLDSERLVEQYFQNGVPATIYRPGNITCQYETGIFQKNINANAVYRMLKGFILLGVAPDVTYDLDFTMVNFASKAITTIAMDDDSIGGVYNICNPTSVPYKEVMQTIKEMGYAIDLVPQEEYVDYLYSDEVKGKEGLELAMAGLEGDGAKDSPITYVCPNTMEMLKKHGVAAPKPDKAFIHRMLEYGMEVGYFTKPAVFAEV